MVDVSSQYDAVMDGKRIVGWDFVPVPYTQVANLDFGPAHVRVVFSLREDYLANLETCFPMILLILSPIFK